MTIIDAFNSFLLKKRLRNLSPKTISAYKSFVSPFIHYVGESSDIMKITTDICLNYISSLYDRQLADATRATYIRHIKAFLHWLKDKYSIPVALSDIEIPKVGKKLVAILTADDIQTILSCISCESEWLRIRNCAIIALMLDSGLRQNEVTTLLQSNIKYKLGYIIVHGKGNKERCVPLGSVSRSLLQKYQELCPYTSNYVFVERHGKPLTNNAVKLMVQKLKKASGIDFSSHKLRHNFATNFCIDRLEESGQCDAYTLQTIMGHENIKTTESYMHYAQSMIASKNCRSHLDRVFGV